MDEFVGVLREVKKLPINTLPSETAFWYGYVSGRANSVSSGIFQDITKLNYYYNESSLLNNTLFEFFLMLLSTNSTRFNEVFNEFQETLNSEQIKSLLSDPEQNILNEIFFTSVNNEEEEEKVFEEYPIEYPQINNLNIEKEYPEFNEFEIDDGQQIYQPQPDMNCGICLENFALSDYVPLTNCCCVFDTMCINKYLNLEIQQRKFPIKCPGCGSELNEQDINDRVDPNIRENYLEYNFKKFVGEHSNEYSCCPTPDCRNVFIANNQDVFDCALCRKKYCLACKVNYHTGMTCEKFRESEINKKTQNADNQFMNFVRGTNYKQCPNCKFWVEKSSGCNHMVCRCRYEFCYACGGKYMACKCVEGVQNVRPIRLGRH